MLEKALVIVNKIGMHARPAALLVKAANDFSCEVSIIKGEKVVNAKSILGLMSAGIKQGESVTLRVNGLDEQQALPVLIALIESGFGEK